MSVSWLSCYPRSGSTWLRYMVTRYLSGPVSSYWDVQKMCPDVHTEDGMECFAKIKNEKHRRHLVKCHNLPSHVIFKSAPAECSLYLLRHPKDVMLSALRFHLMTGKPINERQYVLDFIENKGCPMFLEMGMGTWEEHTRSWRQAHGAIGCVRYETMRERPFDVMKYVLNDILVEFFEKSELQRAIDDCTIDKMRAIEKQGEEFGCKSVLGKAQGHTFIGHGKVGRVLDDHDLNAKFDDEFAPLLEEFGYALETV